MLWPQRPRVGRAWGFCRLRHHLDFHVRIPFLEHRLQCRLLRPPAAPTAPPRSGAGPDRAPPPGVRRGRQRGLRGRAGRRAMARSGYREAVACFEQVGETLRFNDCEPAAAWGTNTLESAVERMSVSPTAR